MKLVNDIILSLLLVSCVNHFANGLLLLPRGEQVYDLLLSGHNGTWSPIENQIQNETAAPEERCILLRAKKITTILVNVSEEAHQCFDLTNENVAEFNRSSGQESRREIVIEDLDRCNQQTQQTVSDCYARVVSRELQNARIYTKRGIPLIDRLFSWPRRICLQRRLRKVANQMTGISNQIVNCILESVALPALNSSEIDESKPSNNGNYSYPNNSTDNNWNSSRPQVDESWNGSSYNHSNGTQNQVDTTNNSTRGEVVRNKRSISLNSTKIFWPTYHRPIRRNSSVPLCSGNSSCPSILSQIWRPIRLNATRT